MARGALDALVGGPGLKTQRRDPMLLEVDDRFHFWRVSQVDRPHLLVLESHIKAPGDALMVFKLTSRSGYTELVLESVFIARGVLGISYWYGLYPAHQWVFRSILKGIGRKCGAHVFIGPEKMQPES